MARAAVLIGVNKTGGLPELSDAVAGARRMEAWALDQGMHRKHVHLFTDQKDPVEIAPIKKAIRALVDSGTITQLIVYFAGHGVNIRYGEYWLLSGAPIDTSAAVNVDGSVRHARRSGIDHIVFVSDACRTAAEGLQAQGVTGSELFPNDPVDGPERAVDLFFATTLGRPALEVSNPNESSAAFQAVYTTTFLDAVSGKLSHAVLEAVGRTPQFVVRPRSLKACLHAEMPRRLAALRLSSAVNQEPDARITSDDDAWVAGFDAAPAMPQDVPFLMRTEDVLLSDDRVVLISNQQASKSVPRRKMPRPSRRAPVRSHTSVATTIRVAANRQLDDALNNTLTDGVRPPVRGQSVVPLAEPFGPLGFDTHCGFKLRGATLADAVSSSLRVEIFEDDASLARVHPQTGAGNVLLVLADQTSVLLPAIPGFITALSFDAGRLVDVAYEPSQHSDRWADFAQHAKSLRQLRSAVAFAAREGVFRLEGPAALELAQRMQVAKGVDPSLALYAAYAYDDMQQVDLLRDMRDHLRMDLGISFFDLDLLTGALSQGEDGEERRFPPVPMFAKGWSLLSAFDVLLNDDLFVLHASVDTSTQTLQSELVDTLWTQFKPTATEHLRNLIKKGKIP